MKAYYEAYNFPTSAGKLIFKLDGTFDTLGSERLWIRGKDIEALKKFRGIE